MATYVPTIQHSRKILLPYFSRIRITTQRRSMPNTKEVSGSISVEDCKRLKSIGLIHNQPNDLKGRDI